MGSLIRRITNLGMAGYGVNLWEIAPPRNVQGEASNVIGMVAELPWGPADEIVTVYTPAEFFEQFYPPEFGSTKDYTTYPAILALLNKAIFTKGGLKVVRVGATSQATADYTFQSAAPADSVDVTANHPGALGNSIQVAWTVNADDATARDATVTIGTEYSETYEAVATIVGGALVVTDPGDPFVTFAKHTGATAVPAAVSATALAGGSDGTAVAADYVGAVGSLKGIRLFYGDSVDVDVLFVAECPSALLDSVNDGLEAYVGEDKGLAILCTVDGQAYADAITYVADYEDERLVYVWPRAETTNFFDAAAAEIEVDGNAFAAALIANVDPWLSPGGAGKRVGTTDLLSGITGLEDETTSRSALDALNDAGIAPWFISSALGPIMRLGTTTDGGRIWDRRIKDYLLDAIAAFAENYVETQLDLDLDNQILGPNTSGFIAAIQQFLAQEKAATHVKAYTVDAFSENTEAGIDAGRWIVLIRVETYAMAEQIVFKAQIGTTVTISEA